MDIEKRLIALGNDTSGNSYEKFAKCYISILNNVKNVWLTKEVPQNLADELNFPFYDQGLDGLYLDRNGLYGVFQAKYRSGVKNKRLPLNGGTSTGNAFTSFFLFSWKNNLKVAPPIYITTYGYLSEGTVTEMDELTRFILYEDQIDELGRQAFEVYDGLEKPTIKQLILHPYQEEAVKFLEENLKNHSKEYSEENFKRCSDGEIFQHTLIHAFTGAGKTLIMLEFIKRFHLRRNGLIVIVAPTLQIIEQTARFFEGQYKGCHPITFASEGFGYHTTQKDIKNKLDNQTVIFTTKASYKNLLELVLPDLIIYDEAHNIKNFYEDQCDIIGFTATPSKRNEFMTPVFRKSLNWGISNNYLVDYQVNCFVFCKEGEFDGDVEEESKDVNVYTSMIVKIMNSLTRLLVICKTQEVARTISKLLNENKIKSYSVTAETSQTNRRRIENDIKEEGGVLVSVNIYKEGADLPWLEGVFVCTSSSSQIVIAQILGRVLRKYPGKGLAKLYFPVISGEKFFITENTHFARMLYNLKILAEQDLEIFSESEKQNRKKSSKIKVILMKENKAHQDIQEEIENKIFEELVPVPYHKTGPKIIITMTEATAAAILTTHKNFVFNINDVTAKGVIIRDHLKGKGTTPGQTMSAKITQIFTKEKKILERLSPGIYKIVKIKELEDIAKIVGDDLFQKLK